MSRTCVYEDRVGRAGIVVGSDGRVIAIEFDAEVAERP